MVYLVIDALYASLLYCLCIDIGKFFANSKQEPEVIVCPEPEARYQAYSLNFNRNGQLQNTSLLMNYLFYQEYRTIGLYKVILFDEGVVLEIEQELLFNVNMISMSKSFFVCEIQKSKNLPQLELLLLNTERKEQIEEVKALGGTGIIKLNKRFWQMGTVTWLLLLINSVTWLAAILLPYE